MPVMPPLPQVAVVAPAPALKQARAPHQVRTETMEAIDAPYSLARGRARNRRDKRGQNVDILV